MRLMSLSQDGNLETYPLIHARHLTGHPAKSQVFVRTYPEPALLVRSFIPTLDRTLGEHTRDVTSRRLDSNTMVGTKCYSIAHNGHMTLLC
jgi:hypothetical protein